MTSPPWGKDVFPLMSSDKTSHSHFGLKSHPRCDTLHKAMSGSLCEQGVSLCEPGLTRAQTCSVNEDNLCAGTLLCCCSVELIRVFVLSSGLRQSLPSPHMSPRKSCECQQLSLFLFGPVHTGRTNRFAHKFAAILLTLLASCVNTPICNNVSQNCWCLLKRCSASCVNGTSVSEWQSVGNRRLFSCVSSQPEYSDIFFLSGKLGKIWQKYVQQVQAYFLGK